MSRLLPDVGDELLLSVPQTEQVLARVAAEGPGFFDLDLLEQPTTPQPMLERSALMIEFINDDELVEVTPQSIRLRKSVLNPNERKKEERRKESAGV